MKTNSHDIQDGPPNYYSILFKPVDEARFFHEIWAYKSARISSVGIKYSTL